MLCKTRIVLGDEYPVMGYPTEQRQMRHEAYTLTARLVLGISLAVRIIELSRNC
jgi:hypothetical protein